MFMILCTFYIINCSNDDWQNSYVQLQEGEIDFDYDYNSNEADIIINIPMNTTSFILYENGIYINRWQDTVGFTKRRVKKSSGSYVYYGEIFSGQSTGQKTNVIRIHFQ